jgi:hypothetical protein
VWHDLLNVAVYVLVFAVGYAFGYINGRDDEIIR